VDVHRRFQLLEAVIQRAEGLAPPLRRDIPVRDPAHLGEQIASAIVFVFHDVDRSRQRHAMRGRGCFVRDDRGEQDHFLLVHVRKQVV
jgi:hypothetical protein